MAKTAKKSSVIGDLATPVAITLKTLQQQKEALDILTEVSEDLASKKEYTEKELKEFLFLPEVSDLTKVLHLTDKGKFYTLEDKGKVLKSTGTNGLAVVLPTHADVMYARLMEISTQEKALEMETLQLQNELRQMIGQNAYGVLPSRLKAICRERVHQPPKVVNGFSFRQFKFVDPPMVD